jgi:hypothetical protein
MTAVFQVIFFIILIPVGMGLHYLLRWPPRFLLPLCGGIIILLPPFRGAALTSGLMLAAAFIERPAETNQVMDIGESAHWWRQTLYGVVLSFSGFILALLLVWRLQFATNLNIPQREIFSWLYLALLEICLFRIIAWRVPTSRRAAVGYGIGAANYFLLFYWIYPLGIICWLLFPCLLLGSSILLTLIAIPVVSQETSRVWKGRR